MPDLLKKTSPEPLQVYSDTDVTEIVENASLFLDQAVQYQELMMMYDCAIKEVRTKLEVLNSEFSVRYQRNPIEFISSRIKKPVSIVRKMRQRGLPLTFSSLEQNLNDVAGIRVICSFIDDIYAVADMLIRQDDVTLLEKKDYIKSPKENGYRSLHLIVEIPVFFSDHKRDMKVEVQIRTIAMDFWASLEHQLKYKKSIEDEEEIIKELRECADTIAATDARMLSIRNRIHTSPNREAAKEDDPIIRYEKIQIPFGH
ncbi:GTP pyrophosphokinase family protein [Cuneatibacter sp. NSJ-177]|uniref:GTP pyrophosphokinase n=1 Tax=Cuneatibacter sp. NSJ-177 TaxID=2931401 RepID=UPI001FCFD992|nr:GTP pyrophosphokinase family protein [Cuneatibacter sp. NSJ-177]MCJ7835939.1 GTP pyrophosphokinase family protein [Cuneatibacter sp. NSJ-177]